jgi:diguanylate cyclase (GGDEF)-like protein
MELLLRLVRGSIIYPILLILLASTTSYRNDHPQAFRRAILAIAIALAARIIIYVCRERFYARGRRWILVPLSMSVVLSAGAAGLLHLNVMMGYGFSNWTFTMVMIWIVGIASGSTISFTPNFSLLWVHLLLLFGPALPYDFLAGTQHGRSNGLATFALLGFLLLQGHRLHGMYWSLLLDRALEVQRTEELEAATAAAESAQERLRHQATHDTLTGVMNRAEVLRVFEREFEHALRTGTSLGVLMLDLDHFKEVNDRYGHQDGDEVLRSVAERVRCSVRSYDSVGRYGGEEFLIVFPGCGLEQCVQSAERIRKAIGSDPVSLSHTQTLITASFGVTVVDRSMDTDQRQPIGRADKALYAAKKNGRNRVEIRLSESPLTPFLPA